MHEVAQNWSIWVGKEVNIKLMYLSHGYILLIMGLFQVLIANMMLICAANNFKITKHNLT